MKVRPGIIIIRDSKLLLMRYNYSGQDVYGLPGGNPDDGESLTTTLVRELYEELGVEVAVGPLLVVGEVIAAESGKTTLHCLFSGIIRSGTPHLNPEHTTALECVWKDISEIDSLNLYPNVGLQIQKLLAADKTENVYIGQIPQNWY